MGLAALDAYLASGMPLDKFIEERITKPLKMGDTGFEVSTEVAGAIVTVVSWIAVGVTWFVSRQQTRGAVGSGPAGQVTEV